MRSRLAFLLLALATALACRSRSNQTSATHTDGARALRLGRFQNSYFGGGFDQPLLLAFADGPILSPQARSRGIPERYGVLHLTPSGVDSLLTSLGATDELDGLDSMYDYAPGWTDQHSFYLLLPADSGHRLVVIRAALEDSNKLRADAPRPFKRLFAALLAFAPANATMWTPD